MVRWHHRLNGHEFEPTLGDSEGQGGLVCCSPWGHKDWDTTKQLNNNKDEVTERLRKLSSAGSQREESRPWQRS